VGKQKKQTAISIQRYYNDAAHRLSGVCIKPLNRSQRYGYVYDALAGVSKNFSETTQAIPTISVCA
jgi:hypothetical protein